MTLSTDTTGARIQSGNWDYNPSQIEEWYQTIAPAIQTQNWISRGILGASAVLLAGTVICSERLNNTQKGLALLASLAGSAAYSIVTSTKQWKLQRDVFNSLHNARKEILKQGLIHQTNLELMHQEIEGVNTRISAISGAAHPELVAEMMRRYDVPLPRQQVEVIESRALPTETTIQAPQDFSQYTEQEWDQSWLKAQAKESEAVFGSKGSGKSTYLSYKGNSFLSLYPNGQLLIGSTHYDFDEDNWIPGAPRKFVESIIKTDKDDIYRIFLTAKKLLQHRKENKLRNEPPFLGIIDEFQGLVSIEWSQAQAEEAVEILQFVQFEGRKYGVNLCLGLHTIKKGESKIDSSVLFNMDMVVCGDMLADKSSPFPGNFDRKTLLSAQYELSDALGSKGRAVIFRKLQEPPKVVPFLRPDLSQFKFNVSGTAPDVVADEEEDDQPSANPLEALLELKEQLGRMPTDQELLSLYKTITGQDLNDKGLAYAKEWLSKT
jgi:hypothetical protein